MQDIALAGLTAAGFAAAVYWLVVLYRVAITVWQLPTGRDGVALADTEHAAAAAKPMVVVVPAHNEEATIGGLIASLLKQDHRHFKVVVALDRCTDNTAGVVRRLTEGDDRFEVMTIDHCPPGWAGKVHAIHAGLARSRAAREAAFLLFTDADCVLEPGCLRAAAALLAERGLHLLSFLNQLTTDRWFEKLAQPVAGFELMRQYPLLRVNRGGERQRAFANGQFLLFDAEAYRHIGGHEAVKDELLEDIALARLIKQAGLRGGLLSSGGIARCRMYDSWAQFQRGWKRIYTEAASRRSDRLGVAAWRLIVTAGLLPLACVAGVALGLSVTGGGALAAWAAWMGAAGGALFVAALAVVYRYAATPLWATPLAPLGALLVGGVLLGAARDLRRGTPTEWGGRAYVRPDRAAKARPRAADDGVAASAPGDAA